MLELVNLSRSQATVGVGQLLGDSLVQSLAARKDVEHDRVCSPRQ